jgi:hypothetical protein
MTMDLLAQPGAILAVLVLAALGLLALLAMLGFAARGRRVPAPLWGLPAALVAAVALGVGWVQLGDVLALTGERSRAYAPQLVTSGGAAAIEPALWGCALAGALAVLAAWLVALVPLIRREPGSRWSPGHAVLPAVLAAGGAPILARFTPPIAPLIVLLASAPCLLVALRCSRSEDRDQAVHSGLASARFSVAVLAAAGALALAQAVRIHSAWAVMRAVGMAAATTKQQLLVALHHHHSGPATILAALVVLAVGAAVVAPTARQAWGRREVISGALLLCLALPPLAVRGLLVDRLAQVREAARPWFEDRVEGLATQEIELPRSTSAKMPSPILSVSVSPSTVHVEDAAFPRVGPLRDGMLWPLFEALDQRAVQYAALLGEGEPFRGTLTLELHRELRWVELEPVLLAIVGARFQDVAVGVTDEQRRLRVFDLVLSGQAHPDAGSAPLEPAAPDEEERFVRLAYDLSGMPQPRIRLEALEGVWRLVAPGMEPQLAGDTAQLAQAARTIKDEYPDDEELLVLPVASTTWGELVAALDAVRGPTNYEDVMFPYPRIVLRVPWAQEPTPRP